MTYEIFLKITRKLTLRNALDLWLDVENTDILRIYSTDKVSSSPTFSPPPQWEETQSHTQMHTYTHTHLYTYVCVYTQVYMYVAIFVEVPEVCIYPWFPVL